VLRDIACDGPVLFQVAIPLGQELIGLEVLAARHLVVPGPDDDVFLVLLKPPPPHRDDEDRSDQEHEGSVEPRAFDRAFPDDFQHVSPCQNRTNLLYATVGVDAMTLNYLFSLAFSVTILWL